MKTKSILILIMSLSFTYSQAQTIPNAGFENWTNHGNYDTPDSWLSFNKLYATSGVFGCEKGTPGMVGSYFLKLTTRVVGGNPYPAAAVSTKDTAFVNSMPSGFPYNLRPLNFTGQYQYHETGMDSAAIEVFLTKWNTSTKKRDIVGSGQIYPSGGIVSSWTKFNIPILYSLTNNPDSALILIYSSINTQTSKWVANDYLYVDDLAFSTTTGINNMESTKFTLAPNPFDLQTTILFADDQQNTKVTIYDLLGNQIKTVLFSGKQLNLEKSDMKAGVYFVEIKDEKNTVVNKKIVIQ